MERSNLKTNFLVMFVEDLPQKVRKAHLSWHTDMDGRKRQIRDLNLKQLGVDILCHSVDDSTRNGWFFFRGSLDRGVFPKD
jgi:hypothetical protein